MVQHILVCAQDSVLAKKVRFLLARDECEVEILSKPSQLERRLGEGNIALLILSRSLDGEDAIEMLARFDPSLMIPPTIVLGGQPTITADFISVIPDPIDTQAIYRIASEALAYQVVNQEVAGLSDEELTHIAIDREGEDEEEPVEKPQGPTTNPNIAPSQIGAAPPPRDEDLAFTDVTGLDQIAGELDLLEGAESMLNDAFDVDVPNNPGHNKPHKRGAASKQTQDAPVLGGLLEPARFAKVLYQCWAKNTTGALIVARDHETLTIHFENGSPVHVESSIPGDPLGRALVSRARITEAQYADGAKRAIERGLRLGQALVELGFFSNQELGRELGTSAREQIVGCFAARQGAFEFDPKRKVPTDERPYQLSVGQILSEGIKLHGDEAILKEIIGEIDSKYFKLNRPVEDLQKRFPLEPKELAFLAFSGRAYNVGHAAENAGLDLHSAHKLMGVLITCEEVQDFTPGPKEFEARIMEELQRKKELEDKLKTNVSDIPPPAAAKSPTLPPRTERAEVPLEKSRSETFGKPFGGAGTREIVERRAFTASAPERTIADEFPNLRKVPTSTFDASPPPPSMPPPPPPISQVSAPPQAPATVVQPHPASNGDAQIPPMPVPPNGEGMVPRPLVYAKPLPRAADGSPLETQERTLSREHFQRGVTLLGQGNFASAEEAFRDAVALCAEEHVYLIGLARAIYYNPGYRAEGKVPVLKAIVGRAEQLAPEDNRVATLSTWISHAESQLSRSSM
jgi:hypothetical protein